MSIGIHKCVCLIGTFPPPIHGMSNVNSQVFLLLSDMKFNVKTIDTSPPNWLSLKFFRILKPFKIGLSYLYLLYLSIVLKPTFYIGISGGLGQIYEVFYVLISRIFNHKIFIHHHSFAYINKKSAITNLITKLATSDATHIFLCENMAEKFINLYPKTRKTFILSNSCFINQEKNYSSSSHLSNSDFPGKHSKSSEVNIQSYDIDIEHSRMIQIGFLGNITVEKGILDFLKIVELIKSQNLSYKTLVAGPCENKNLKDILNNQTLDNPSFNYIGAVYNNEKIEFFNEVDLLIFPTNYINEAEPLTILEAISHGVPVISKNRGCIKSIISDESGWIIEDEQDFPCEALKIIQCCHSEPSELNHKKSSATSHYRTLKNESYEKLLNLINCF